MKQIRNPEKLKAASRGVSRDMSPEAISRRFDILVELQELAQALTAAKLRPLGKRR